MTGKEYISEMKVRLARLEVRRKLGDAELLNYVNMGRRAVARILHNIEPERFGNIILVPYGNWTEDTLLETSPQHSGKARRVWRVPMPEDFVDAETVTVVVLQGDMVVKREARRQSKKEMYNVLIQSWNMPTLDSPVYCVEYTREHPQGAVGWYLYIMGLEIDGGYIFNTAPTAIEVWYVTAIDDLEIEDEETTLPSWIEEYALYHALMYCLQMIAEHNAYMSLMSDMEYLKMVVRDNYTIKLGQEIALASQGE